ncbi:competence protein ComEA helix-hairpin-helix repeat region [Luminiphilus syltensis NOR5-1B]|uniref:Competence protein ComEA helix-hairpin-helix repeat region n=1 Tax=Luminiphilus syltensis NOR5-1B TaxID=565045 RepID=B8KX36_9GAMM|nr:ComEA family DNA-binding protein [Luminiphilus syltensis]EED35948.1 competence protein ComEA helix-hairpin-helix repeat region [Luminiphilus syltensis NOR5-1B]
MQSLPVLPHHFSRLVGSLFLALALLLAADFSLAEDLPVNINTATAEQLSDALKGIGMSKAVKIVEYREANGPFEHIDELSEVNGIGESTVDKNRQIIVLD